MCSRRRGDHAKQNCPCPQIKFYWNPATFSTAAPATQGELSLCDGRRVACGGARRGSGRAVCAPVHDLPGTAQPWAQRALVPNGKAQGHPGVCHRGQGDHLQVPIANGVRVPSMRRGNRVWLAPHSHRPCSQRGGGTVSVIPRLHPCPLTWGQSGSSRPTSPGP